MGEKLDSERASQCLGKTPYPTKAAALAVNSRRSFKGNIGIYRCDFCHKWHRGGDHRLEKKKNGK